MVKAFCAGLAQPICGGCAILYDRVQGALGPSVLAFPNGSSTVPFEGAKVSLCARTCIPLCVEVHSAFAGVAASRAPLAGLKPADNHGDAGFGSMQRGIRHCPPVHRFDSRHTRDRWSLLLQWQCIHGAELRPMCILMRFRCQNRIVLGCMGCIHGHWCQWARRGQPLLEHRR